jgi:predicted nucleic acid-binding protein
LGLNQLRSFLQRQRLLALDTCVFIYQLEGNARYLPISDYVFSWLEHSEPRAVTSTITMTELLVQPYRTGNEELVDQFYGLLTTYPNLTWMAPSLEIADLAAKFRALHRMRTPDALLAATAVHAGATGLITNDPVFERVKEFETLVLDSFL